MDSWRMVHNADLKKTMKAYYEDIYCKNHNARRIQDKVRRARIKEEARKEIEKYG